MNKPTQAAIRAAQIIAQDLSSKDEEWILATASTIDVQYGPIIDRLWKLLNASRSGLRSYEYGNSNPTLAIEIIEKITAALAELGDE